MYVTGLLCRLQMLSIWSSVTFCRLVKCSSVPIHVTLSRSGGPSIVLRRCHYYKFFIPFCPISLKKLMTEEVKNNELAVTFTDIFFFK